MAPHSAVSHANCRHHRNLSTRGQRRRLDRAEPRRRHGRGRHDIHLVRPFQPGVSTLHPRSRSGTSRTRWALPKYPGLPSGFLRAEAHAFFTSQRPDAVYVATEGPLGWSAVRTARRFAIPVATGFHTRFDAYAGAYGLGPLTRWCVTGSGAFTTPRPTVVPTPELRNGWNGMGFQRVRVVARGFDSRCFDPARRRQKLRDRWGSGRRARGDLLVALPRKEPAARNRSLS